MEKPDLTKLDRAYYQAKSQPELVHILPARYISLTGQGDPSSADFAAHIQALYTAAYGIKAHYKSMGNDFVVPKLEGLWWFDMKKYDAITLHNAPTRIPRSEWSWRLMIRMPDMVSPNDIPRLLAVVADKKDMALVKRVTVHTMEEGKVVQALHTGPFDSEPETLLKIQQFMEAHNLEPVGLHHEIYLSDFRLTAPEKLRTILREPVRQKKRTGKDGKAKEANSNTPAPQLVLTPAQVYPICLERLIA